MENKEKLLSKEEKELSRKEYRKRYYKENKERIDKRQKEHNERNKDKVKEYKKNHYERNKNKIKERSKNYYKKNKEKIEERRLEYREENKEKIAKTVKKYAKKNKVKLKAQREEYKSRPEVIKRSKQWYREYYKKKRQDPIYRLNETISKGIRNSLNFNGMSKNGRHWEDLVGYTLQELKEYLEKLFTSGMSWGTMRKWHIDHIIPKSFFVYTSTDDVEFKYCWSLDNLQPLWATDNIKKGDKVRWAL